MRPVLRWTAVVAVVGIGASVGVIAFTAEADPAARYRLATAALGDVAQTVATNGTVDFVNRADVSFGVDGTLAELSVAQGQQVSAGQSLATLDRAALQAAVDAAEADLANAKATLEADQQRQEESVQPPADRPSADGGGGGGGAQLGREQQAVRTAQTAAGKAIGAAKAALAAQAKACAAAPPADGTTAEGTTAEATPTDPACADALAAAMSAQDAVAGAQDNLQKAIDDLATALAAAASQVDTPAAAPQDRGGGTDPAPTAATIAGDQAAVDTATAGLLAANQALDQATLTAPIAGTVASVEVAAGDAVSAGTTAVVLIGAGAAVVETTVPVERIGEIEVGQTATVTPTGAARGVRGTVSRIGRLADAGADAVAYPVTVTVDEPTAAMPAGSTAGVAIVVATADNVLTVPTSAVAHRGNATTVSVLAGTEASPREVVVGATGPLRTEVRDGLEAGERVVLADLSAALPSADQQTGPGLGGGAKMPGVMRSGPGARAGK